MLSRYILPLTKENPAGAFLLFESSSKSLKPAMICRNIHRKILSCDSNFSIYGKSQILLFDSLKSLHFVLSSINQIEMNYDQVSVFVVHF